MEIGALLLALLNLVLVVLERRWETAPQREAKAERKDVLGDVDRLNEAIRERDPEDVAAFFEDERREALGRVPAADVAHGVQPADRDDPGQPPAPAAPERTVGRD